MSSSELRNRSHPGAQNANPLNKWASNKEAIQALPSNLKVSKRTRSLASKSKNLQVNFLKCNGVIAPVSNAADNRQFTLNVSTLTYFVNYTDFNKLNPDTSVTLNPQVFSDWYTHYISAKNQTDGNGFLPYEPSAIVSYHDSLGNRLNYICKITNIVYNQDASGNPIPLFTFDTTTVKIYDKNSFSIKKMAAAAAAAVAGGESASDVYDLITSSNNHIVNDPEVTKIDTNFLSGIFNNIKIDFNPIYDQSYKHNRDISYFIQSDININKHNEKYIVSVSQNDRFVGYRCWNNRSSDRNKELEVYVDTISYLTRMFKKVFSNRTDTPANFFKPSITLEIRSRDGKTSTFVSQITDCYTYKDNILFELDNENVKIHDDNVDLVSSYNSISKILQTGKFSHAIINAASCDCGSFSSFTPPAVYDGCSGCSPNMGCFYKWSTSCCTNHVAGCPNFCDIYCNGECDLGWCSMSDGPGYCRDT